MYKVSKINLGNLELVLRKSRNGQRVILENVNSGEKTVARTERFFEKNLLINNISELVTEVEYFPSFYDYKRFMKLNGKTVE